QAPVTLSAEGVPLRVFHPFTPASVQDPPVEPSPYDVEVFPTFATFQAGHRIRLDIASGDTPHLMPSLPHQEAVAGAVFMIDRGGGGHPPARPGGGQAETAAPGLGAYAPRDTSITGPAGGADS